MKKRNLLLISLFACVLTLTGCGKAPTLKDGSQVVAQVDGKEFTAENLYDKLKESAGQATLIEMVDTFILNEEYETDDAAKDYAESQIEAYKKQYESYGYEFSDALKQAGYSKESDLKDSLIIDYKKDLATDDYIKDNNITESEINAYYKSDIYGDIEAKHILITSDAKEDASDSELEEAKKKAKEEAEDVLKKLKDGEKFEDLVKKYSDDDGTKKNEGSVTYTYHEVDDSIWDAVDKIKDGEYTDVVESTNGYEIIYRVKQNKKPSLSSSKDNIIDALVKEKKDADSTLSTKAISALREKYNLDIIDDNMKKEYKKSLKEELNADSNNNTNSNK